MKNITVSLIIFMTILAGCNGKNTDVAELYNQEASLANTLPFNPLEWKVISAAGNEKDNSMSTLYGNEVAVKSARTGAANGYPAGSKLSLITWVKKEDKHWFGANIPGAVKSVELVEFTTTGSLPVYEYYEGNPLKKAAAQTPEIIKNRTASIINQKASVMP